MAIKQQAGRKVETYDKRAPAKLKEKAHQQMVKKRRAKRNMPGKRKPEKKPRVMGAEMPPRMP
jgi:hypothetical protein